MSGATVRWRLVCRLAAVCGGLLPAAGCGPPPTDPGSDATKFQQSRSAVALEVKIASLEQKLAAVQEELTKEQSRYDALKRELLREQNLHKNDLINHELALRLNSQMKAELADARAKLAVNEGFRDDVVRLNAEIERLEKDNQALRQQLGRQK